MGRDLPPGVELEQTVEEYVDEHDGRVQDQGELVAEWVGPAVVV